MSSIVQTPELTPVPINLGMSPLQIASLYFLGFGLGGVALGGIAAANNGGTAGVLFVILMLPWSILMLYLGVRVLILLVTGGGAHYRRTKSAIREGRLGLTYYVKGNDDIVVVDEPGRLLCINGDVMSFDQIKNLTWTSGDNKHRLAFSLTSGANPVRNVGLYNPDKLKVAFERLSNSLSFKSW